MEKTGRYAGIYLSDQVLGIRSLLTAYRMQHAHETNQGVAIGEEN
jgi:hypothetical protein